MSLRAMYDTLFGKKKKEGEISDQREKLAQLGVIVTNDDKLKERIRDMDSLQNYVQIPITGITAEDKMDGLSEKLFEIDRRVRKVAIPYCRAGTEPKYASMLKGWEKLLQLGIDLITYTKTSMTVRASDDIRSYPELDSVNQEGIYRKLEACINMEVIRYALLITDMGYFGRDVSPAFTLVIPTQMPMYGYSVTPSEAMPARKEFPSAAPRPTRLPSELEDANSKQTKKQPTEEDQETDT